MGQDNFPLIDGQYVSWVEMGFSLEVYGGPSFQTKDFAAANFSDKLEPGKVRGTGPTIVGRTFGQYDADASITMYYASYIYFQRALKLIANAAFQGRVGAVPFDIPISWTPLGGVGEVFSAKLVGARIAGRDLKAAAGSTDALTIDIPLSIIRLELDDTSLV